MANFGANLDLIQIHLIGKNEKDIEKLQWINNYLNQTKFNYTPPTEKKNGTWIVWFYADIREWKDPRELGPDEIKLLPGFGG